MVKMETLIVPGGAGFIGVHFVRCILIHTQPKIVVIDTLTYAGHLCSLQDLLTHPCLTFLEADIANEQDMERLFSECHPTSLFNFAAETHVDRSIDNLRPFLTPNVIGVSVLLAQALKYFRQASLAFRKQFRFLHVSTDEMLGIRSACQFERSASQSEYVPL